MADEARKRKITDYFGDSGDASARSTLAPNHDAQDGSPVPLGMDDASNFSSAKRTKRVSEQNAKVRQDDAVEEELPVSFNAIIYAYYEDNTPVYVGQTVQDLLKRDVQHWTGMDTPFDRAYHKDSTRKFKLRVVESKFFHAAEHQGNRERMAENCQSWMNQREMNYIKTLRTYRDHHKGLN